ncbi:TIGR01244 family sulfur transferase [Pararhizobium mangrovi]|uniref:TIGR01244 family phosphatase n=1 Tax=Pararhizobium mangrovi TaxID=2590452 RepID=A0A506U6B0_9HYPH|nr:TIGR01244 family sulfur transferase [Pararhizobium mangrovi]TPW29903.1 TIGR01244 family phosphatase [Pararhizobium mangrovi]
MDIRKIDEEYAVSGQIAAEDVPQIREMGYRAIVCHRPDGEAEDQPAFEEIRRAAEGEGLEIRQIPVGSMGVTPDNVHAMVDALDEMPRPMLGFCRSGARSTRIYEQTRHIRS